MRVRLEIWGRCAAFADQYGNNQLLDRVSRLLQSLRHHVTPTEISLIYVGETNAKLIRRFILSGRLTIIAGDCRQPMLSDNWCES